MGVSIVSVPAGQVFVGPLDAPPGPGRVARLPDPPVADGSSTTPRWPSAVLDRDWSGHADEFDAKHVHFGLGYHSLHVLRLWGIAPREQSKLLLSTIQDPPIPYRARVLSHPHVIEETTLPGGHAALDGFVTGVDVNGLRDTPDLLLDAEQLLADLPVMSSAQRRGDAPHEGMEHAERPHGQRVTLSLTELVRAGLIDLHVHDYFTDCRLWEDLSGLDVSVLPYRLRTHSGCLDAERVDLADAHEGIYAGVLEGRVACMW